MMLVQVNSDNSTPVDAVVSDRLETLVRRKLDRISDRLTRVEVHVGDVNGPKGGEDKRCTVEVRPNGMAPLSATDGAASLDAAVGSATEKVLSAFDRQVGRTTTRKGH